MDYRENLNQNRLWIYNDTVYLSVQDYNPNLVYKMFRITDDKPDYYVEQTAYAEIINLDAKRGLLYYIEEPENLDLNSGGYLRQKNLETGEVTEINTFYDGFSYTCESVIDPETGALYLNYPNGNGAFGDIALNKWDGSFYSMDGSLYMMKHLLGIASRKLYVETFADQQEDWAVSSGAFVGNLYEKDLDNGSGDFQLVMDGTITLTNCRVEDGVLLYFPNDTAVPGGVPLSNYDTAFVNEAQDVFSIDFSVMSDEANSEIFCYRHDKETGEAIQIAAIPMEQGNYAPFIMTGTNWQEVDGYLYGPVAIYDKGMLNAGGVKPLEYRVYRVNEEDGSWEIIA